MNNSLSLRETIPFGDYQPDVLNHRINVYWLNLQIHVESCPQYPELAGKTWQVQNIDYCYARLVGQNNLLNLKESQVSFSLNNQTVELDALIDELQYKDGHHELNALFYATIKDGKYLSNYEFKLRSFFIQNEENFFLLDECLKNGQFCLPKNQEDKARILAYVASHDENLSAFLEHYAFSHEELYPNSNKKMKM
jgi:hypothetical protein